MTWKIISSQTFERVFKKHRKNKEFLIAFDKKLQRLKSNPHDLGGNLSGRLHGYKSTRIVRKYRLLFKIVDDEHTVYLIGIDHRKFDYERFDI